MSIVGATGAAGGGLSLFYNVERITNSGTPQSTNWIQPWGLTLYPALSLATAGLRVYSPFAGNIQKIRCSRAATADDLTFAIEVNGTSRITLLLPNGVGAASAVDNVSTYAVAIGDYVTVSLLAATQDSSSNTYPQLSFLIE